MKIRVGIIGFGTVGSGTVRILREQRALITRRLNCSIEIAKIADLNITRDRGGLSIPKSTLTTDAMKILHDPHIDIVVELIGGYDPAKRFILEAIARGRHVVTANKALLAESGEEIFRAAKAAKVQVGFEGSVGGGIPIIRAIREGFAGERITRIYGIVNGTCNYILSRMTEDAKSFDDVLSEAKSLGYAEANPDLDLEGTDSAHKLTILSHLAFGTSVAFKEVYTEGIRAVTPEDIAFAKEFGYQIKLLAIAKGREDTLEVRVHPTMIPEEHLLSKVSGVYNAIAVSGVSVGEALFYGRGAGGAPTGCAVVSDIMAIARQITQGEKAPPPFPEMDQRLRLQKIDDIETRYYLRFTVEDRPGVLSKISGILGQYQISISSVIQQGRKAKGSVPLVMMTHRAREKDLQEALLKINRLDCVAKPTVLIRVEETAPEEAP